jgi:hypothetical protein
MNKTALVLDPSDNVATLLSDASPGDSIVLKGAPGILTATCAVAFGHKAAIARIGAGEKIIKYGQTIGYATLDITPGEWVHLHNMASVLDADFRKRILQ